MSLPPASLLTRTLGPIAFSGSHIDRADHVRADPEALARLKVSDARLLLLDDLEPRLTEGRALDWGTLADAHDDAELVFLGLDGERGCFVAVPEAAPKGGYRPGRANWSVMAGLGSGELAAYGTARALAAWHANHRFCPVCGDATQLAKGGWQRHCSSEDCGADHFPRVDPVAIMLIEHEGRALLGRGLNFPERRYSTLAGFIEPGESIEEAVVREVYEEAGVRVRDVAYITSQPWPFPASLMIGCHGIADSTEIVIDESEMADVRWFARDEVIEALAARTAGRDGEAFDAPPLTAVAHWLMRWWVERG